MNSRPPALQRLLRDPPPPGHRSPLRLQPPVGLRLQRGQRRDGEERAEPGHPHPVRPQRQDQGQARVGEGGGRAPQLHHWERQGDDDREKY